MTDLLTIYNEIPDPGVRSELLAKLGNPWYLIARKEQLVPRHTGVHMIQAPRGWGKIRSASEWIIDMVERNPGTYLSIVGPTEAYAFNVMVDGGSGILNVSSKYGRDVPKYGASSGQLRWRNGTSAFVRGLDSLDDLRGYNHQFCWLDLGDQTQFNSQNLEERWSSLSAGNTYGVNPQTLITSGLTKTWVSDLVDAKVTNGNPYWTKTVSV